MVKFQKNLLIFFLFLVLGACASSLKKQMKEYRKAFALGDFKKAEELLDKSELKKDKKSQLLWHLEKGTVALNLSDTNRAIDHFQESLTLIDRLYTTKLTSKAATLLINDASDDFYGASYERSYAHYFLAKSYYQRFKTTGNKLDLQGARATILAWDSYFADLQRGASYDTVYQTDLMLKIFGAQVHEVSGVRSDKQISLQLYKDGLKILKSLGGVYSVFNTKNVEYTKSYVEALKNEKSAPEKLYEETAAHHDLRDFLHYKILGLTKEIRNSEYAAVAKSLKPTSEIIKKLADGKSNVVLILEEGLIPPKVGNPFNFGLRGAMEGSGDSKTNHFIASIGVGVITAFAMNELDMIPTKKTSPGSFLFAHEVTRIGVQEAAVEFELPMIENVPLVQRLEVFVLDEKGVVIKRGPVPVISENGDLARVILEEDVVARYVKTGTRVALRHLSAVVAAIGVYRQLKRGGANGDFLAKTAAVATYVGGSKGLSSLEKADTRHWITLPQALRMMEFNLPPGKYKIALGTYSGTKAPETPAKLLADIIVKDSGKSLHTLQFSLNP